MPNHPTPEEIAEKALQPESIETDGEKIKQRSADDVKKFIKMAANVSTRRAWGAISVVRISTPGAGDYE